jgi:deoxyribodipyrimidine photolyase-related protein
VSHVQNVLLIYPHQLYPAELLPKDVDQVFLIEDPLYFGVDPARQLYIHKQKLVLHRASMRRYIEEVLWPAGYQVEYIEFHHMIESSDIVNKLTHAARVEYFDPTDDVLQRKIVSALEGLEHRPEIRQLESPNFYLSRAEVKNFFQKDQAGFVDFYQWQRERFNVLINTETYKPLGGKLSFETETKKRLPKDHVVPGFGVFGSNSYVDEAKEYVGKHFADNPGSLDDFPWPTNHTEADQWLKEFLQNRLEHYSDYEDVLEPHAPWLYHSGISVILNCGLLRPERAVSRALEVFAENNLQIASVETFVRHILGWREFTRGMYIHNHASLRTSNVFDHHRHLTNDWYAATTGLLPVDDIVKKVLTRGYAHHNERLMVLSSAMLLCEINPDEVYRWNMELFVDAYDWTVVPSMCGMYDSTQDLETLKPYTSSANYILHISWYERGLWSDVWDGLYWNFIEKNREAFARNLHMRMAVSQLDKLKPEQRRIISYRAEDFLKEKTSADS